MAGWNGSAGTTAPKKVERKAPSKMRGLVALVAVVVVGGVAAWFILRPADAPTRKKPSAVSSGKIADVSPSVGPDATPAANPAGKKDRVGGARAARQSAQSARNGHDDHGEQVEEPEQPPTVPEKKRGPIFKSGTDQLIYLAVFASKGASIPPLPRMSASDTDRYIKSLQEPIDINPDDPPQIQEMKKQVDQVRKQIAGILAQEPGKELSEILNAHRDDFNSGLNLRSEAQKTYDKMVEEGDEEGAEQYRVKANELLTQYGAEPISEEEEEDQPE